MNLTMNARDRYSTTKFAVLSDGESIRGAKRNYFIWIITVSLIFCITVAYFSYKLFITPSMFNQSTPQSSNTTDTHATVRHLKLHYPGPLLTELKNRSQRKRNEFTYEQSQILLETVPVVYIQKLFQKDYKNLQDFINLDLLLYYEYLINKFEPDKIRMIFNEYQLKVLLLERSDDFVNFLISLKSEKFKFYGVLLKEQKYGLDLQQFEGFFALTQELNHWYNYLHRLSTFLSTYEQQKLRKYFENCTDKNFEKFTEKTQKEIFRFAYPFKITEKKLEEINKIINIWSEPMIVKSDNCSAIFNRNVILLSDVNEEIQRIETSCLKNVFVFASSIIYLDKDLELLGVNLAMVAPVWMFLNKTNINLNGLMAKEYTANFSESGTPGNPGGNAGDFLGVGNFHQKLLTISANGGKGANGQNGAKGSDGIDFTRPDLLVGKPSCVLKLNTYNNTFGQTITHYKVFNPLSCGQSGTDGGVGGSGGAGGVITLINNNSIKISRGLNGTAGAPGKGGAGGKGGRNGCFYEVLDVDDETLHPITRVKCPIGNILPSGQNGKDNYNNQGQVLLPVKENLSVETTLHQFIKLVSQNFVKSNPNLSSLLKNIISLNLYNETNVRHLITEYKSLEWFNNTQFYEIFKEKIIKHIHQADQPTLKYLLSAVLGKMLILQRNVNFYFIDSKFYLNLTERNIKKTSDEPPSASYFKNKVLIKIEEVKKNFNRIKMKSITLTLNLGKHDSEQLNEEKISYFVISTIDVLSNFLNPTFGGIKENEFSKLFRGNGSVLPHEPQHYKSNNPDSTTFLHAEKILMNIVKNLQNNNTEGIEEDLSNFRNVLYALKESNTLSNQIKTLLENLTDEIEHFLALFNFLEWEKLEISFFKSLEGLKLDQELEFEEDNEIKFLKSQLKDFMITLQCKLAVQTIQLNMNSFEDLPSCLHLLQNETVTGFITDHRNPLQHIASVNTDLFFKNHLTAVFDNLSAVGEFYFWPNSQIKNKLKNLFSGAEIYLKSDIINNHIFDKNFIQFMSLKLEFVASNKSSQHFIEDILSFSKVQMIHSGYSYYNWKGETHVIVSEKVNLEYSFKMQDKNEPEVYNSLYKKCKDGEVKLSPFTTWTVRLLPIKDAIDFGELLYFTDSVSLRLIGTGTYIS